MKYFFIMNPASRGGESRKKFPLIHELLKENRICYDFEQTKSLEHACQLSRQANKAGYDVIAAVGGDGTINRVLNGFYHSDGSRNSKAAFGAIHTGTSPDFCKNYQIPVDIKKAIAVLRQAHSRKVAVGRVEYPDQVRYFACCANIGLGAELARGANSGIRKIAGDVAGTFLALLRTLFTYRPIDIIVNGQTVRGVYNLAVGKTYYIASGLKIKNALEPADDQFYMLTVRSGVASILYRMYTGGSLELEYARQIRVEGCGEVELDGDESGRLPCVISNAAYLDVLVEGTNE